MCMCVYAHLHLCVCAGSQQNISMFEFSSQTYLKAIHVSDGDDRIQKQQSGASNRLASLGHTGIRRVVLGHILNTLQHIITKNLIMF